MPSARRRLLVLLDLDGTLAPIRPSPRQVRVSARTRRRLRMLSRLPGARVGIVSGRALGDARRRVGVPGLFYIGNHGGEIAGPGLRWTHPSARAARPALRRLAAQLRAATRRWRGAEVEDKRLSLSVHWRRVAPAARRELLAAVIRVLAPWRRRGLVRARRGKRVLEVLPRGRWHKGTAVARLARRLGLGGRPLIIYIGDDRTDEDAFRVVNRLGGMSIRVGRGPTRARRRLADQAAAGAWLDALARARQATDS